MGDRLERLGTDVVQRVVDLVTAEKHCRSVNSGTTVPINIPLRAIGRGDDDLTLSAGLEQLELEYSGEIGNGRLSVYGGYDFERERGEVGFRYKLFEW